MKFTATQYEGTLGDYHYQISKNYKGKWTVSRHHTETLILSYYTNDGWVQYIHLQNQEIKEYGSFDDVLVDIDFTEVT